MPTEFLYIQMSVLLVFFVVHLLLGAFLRGRGAARPAFYAFIFGAAEETERKLNRTGRRPVELYVRGATVVILMSAFSWWLGYMLQKTLGAPYGAGILLAVFFASLNVMGIVRVLRTIARHLKGNDVVKARQALAVCLPDPTDSFDGHTVARRSVEWAGGMLLACFIAPIFWFLVAGYPAMLLSLALSGMRAAFGTGAARQEFFGSLGRMADRLVSFFPSVLGVFLVTAASLFVGGCRLTQAIRGVLVLPGVSKFDVMTPVLAGALNVTLGGPRRHPDGDVTERPWVGLPGTTAKLAYQDVERMALLVFVVFLLMIVLVSGATIARVNFNITQ